MPTTPANHGKKKPEQGDKVEKERDDFPPATMAEIAAIVESDPVWKQMFEDACVDIKAKPQTEDKTRK
ncbi:uncharacterized protein FIESC28_04088 [Fusarium coffeatum]|uniref:Uncharacterized protein n=1 Tax=Fusarium coffeatum TaxID=231269 RepID=A0A366S1A6_9HYPO|nr:uncharacterized protein FIESC28_04088 [Fusarium coffeatum]RBR23093.1 hypothetical protein FIESC28_04088 [Fusarium coffeatum]